MDRKQIASRFMLAGGSIEILIGLVHFIMPIQIVGASEVASLPDNYKSIITLMSVAVGLCLVVFGTLSLYFSKRIVKGDRSAWIFGISQGVLWFGRTILELIFPVTIPLLFLTNPTVLVLPMVFLLSLSFLIPMWMSKDEFASSS
jgi:uncharacterized protein YjeT (DUF2065 family)